MTIATENTKARQRIERVAHLKWVPINLMKVPPMVQRPLNQSRVDHLANEFDPEQLGIPTVNKRAGFFWLLDGQHRVEMLRQVGWGDQQIQCWVYEDLTEQEEAETFLKLNDTLAVSGFARFRSAITAGREVEVNINKIVKAAGLRISTDSGDGAIHAVVTLKRIYERSDGETLAKTLELVRDAYGDAGLEAAVLNGLAMMVQRYQNELDVAMAVTRLGRAHGGVSGLLGKAEVLRRQTGNQLAICVAAAAVDIINAGRGGSKMRSWWTEEK